MKKKTKKELGLGYYKFDLKANNTVIDILQKEVNECLGRLKKKFSWELYNYTMEKMDKISEKIIENHKNKN